jgi:hypothetical protein
MDIATITVSHITKCVSQSTLAFNKRCHELHRSGRRWRWKVLISTSPTRGTKVTRHLQNSQPVIIDDVRKIVDESCNYAKLNSLETIDSHHKQRHNNSFPQHNIINYITWLNLATRSHTCQILPTSKLEFI